MALENLLEKMSLREILLGTILLKPKNTYFKEEALFYAFKDVADKHSKLKYFFDWHCDGSPEHITSFECTLSFMKMGYILQDTSDWQFVYMTKYGKECTKKELKENYGDEVLGKLKPLADAVWTSYLRYTKTF